MGTREGGVNNPRLGNRLFNGPALWHKRSSQLEPHLIPFPHPELGMYPTNQEKAIVNDAERVMIDTMARYDPSHDKYHGACSMNLHPDRTV